MNNGQSFNCGLCNETVAGMYVMDHLRIMHPGWEERLKERSEQTVYHDAEWPRGLRCGECDVLFSEGDTLARIPDGWLEDETPVFLVVCFECGLKAMMK